MTARDLAPAGFPAALRKRPQMQPNDSPRQSTPRRVPAPQFSDHLLQEWTVACLMWAAEHHPDDVHAQRFAGMTADEIRQALWPS